MKPIIYSDDYLVDETGQVWSKKSNRLLKCGISKTGYRAVQIKCHDGINRTLYVHRLIAETFLINSSDKRLQVNHKDGNKLNNSASNLEWVTQKENLQHARKVLGKKFGFLSGEAHVNAKLNMSKADEIKKRYASGGCSYRSLAKEYGVSALVINQIMNNRIWQRRVV